MFIKMWITYSIKKIPIFKCFFMYKKYLYFIYPQVINKMWIQLCKYYYGLHVKKYSISSIKNI